MIASQAHRFSIPESVHYLNCAYMAPLADTVSAAMVEGAGLKKHPWGFRPADFFTLSEDFRSAAAEVAGVSAECVAIVPSVSYGLAVAAAALGVGAVLFAAMAWRWPLAPRPAAR